MLGALILYLTWAAKSPFNKASGNVTTDPEAGRKALDDAKSKGNKTYSVTTGGLTYIIDTATQAILDVIDPVTGTHYGPNGR